MAIRETLVVTDRSRRQWFFDAATHRGGVHEGVFKVTRDDRSSPPMTVLSMPVENFLRTEVGVTPGGGVLEAAVARLSAAELDAIVTQAVIAASRKLSPA